MFNKILKPLSTLPKDGIYYRIDAMGAINVNPYASTNHIIDIVVSAPWNGMSRKSIFERQNSIQARTQDCYQVSLGEAYAFQPGCIIRNGHIISRPCMPNFDEVIVASPEKIQFIPANLKFSLDGRDNYLIPPYIFRMGKALCSTLMAIESNGDPFGILIPTMEVLRSCYFSSSIFNQRIFSSDADDIAYATTKSYFLDKHNRKLELCLRKEFPDADAIMIGSILTNQHARNELRKIWAQLLKHKYHGNNGPLHSLEIGFPTTGEIRIQGTCVDIPSSQNHPRRKLLTTLTGCQYALPFSHIELHRENAGGQNREEHDETDPRRLRQEERSIAIWPTEIIEPKEGQNTPFSAPTNLLKRAFIEINSQRFPHIYVEKVTKRNGENIRPVISNTPCPSKITNQSTSESLSGQSDSAPISIVPKEKQASTENEFRLADFSSFYRICDGLLNSPHVQSVVPIVVNGTKSNNPNHISQFPSMYGDTKLTWSVIFNSSSDLRIRQLAIRKICVPIKGIFYLMEIERRENNKSKDKFAVYLFSNASHSDISEQKLQNLLLKLACNRFNKYRGVFSDFGFTVTSRKHKGTIDQCVNAILGKIILAI